MTGQPLSPATLENALGFLHHHRLAVESRRKIELSVSVGTITFLSLATYWAVQAVNEEPLREYRLAVLPVAAVIMAFWIYNYRLMLRGIENASRFNRVADTWIVQEIQKALVASLGTQPDSVEGLPPQHRTKEWAGRPPFRVAIAVAVGCWIVLLLACLGVR